LHRWVIEADVKTIQAALQAASESLAAISDTAQLDAEILMAFVLQTTRIALRLRPETMLTAQQFQQYTDLINRRQAREPIAYLTGRKEFWSLDLMVNEHTLVPRPETELLVETALTLFPANAAIRIADLGTGSGAIALALASERPHWQIDAADISKCALDVARKNAQELGLNHISFYQGSWFTALPVKNYDLVLANPPYLSEVEWPQYESGLRHEPRSALVAGHDGLDDLRIIINSAGNYLRPQGFLMLEHGNGQGQAVRALLCEAGCVNVKTHCDLAGRERATIGQY
jgi:release factor glutamine methyltransferase